MQVLRVLTPDLEPSHSAWRGCIASADLHHFLLAPVLTVLRHCPPRVMASLQPYIDGGKLTIVKPLNAGVDPIIELTYQPSAPHFTIRDIISSVSHSKDSDSTFAVSVYKPPTLEERSRAMHAREQRNLLQRLAFSVVAAIPTLIIGVVYMSLVSKTNETRMWFMSPMWTGNASRVDWALFFIVSSLRPRPRFEANAAFQEHACVRLFRWDLPSPRFQRTPCAVAPGF